MHNIPHLILSTVKKKKEKGNSILAKNRWDFSKLKSIAKETMSRMGKSVCRLYI
jgi:hypothetical protein